MCGERGGGEGRRKGGIQRVGRTSRRKSRRKRQEEDGREKERNHREMKSPKPTRGSWGVSSSSSREGKERKGKGREREETQRGEAMIDPRVICIDGGRGMNEWMDGSIHPSIVLYF